MGSDGLFKLASLPRHLRAALTDVEHASPAVRRSAVRDLARFGVEPERDAAIGALQKALRDVDADVRADAVLALSDLGAEGALPELLRLLGDVHLRVRQMALLGLGELASSEDGEVLGRIGSFLNAGEPALRFQALAAWARLVPERLLEVVLERMRDSDPEVRALSLRLAEERWAESPSELPSDLEVALRNRLGDDAPEVRLLAAVLLARKGLSTDALALLGAVERRLGVREPADEQIAIELCGVLGLHEATRALRRRAFGLFGWSRDPFCWHARVALARMGDPRAVQVILDGLRARAWHTRAVAADSAGRAGLVQALPRLEELRSDPRLDPELLETAIAALRDR